MKKNIYLIISIAIIFSIILSTNLSASSNVLNDDDIEGIYMRTQTLYGLGGVYVANVTYLFLKNGDVFRKLKGSPYTLDINHSKQTQAKYWYTWKKKGNKYVVTNSKGKEKVWDTWHETIPAKKGETIEGIYKSASPFTGSKIYDFNTMVFSKDGKFVSGRVKGRQTECKSLLSKKNQHGTYELDRYTITLKQSGKPDETFLFFFYPDSHKHFVIGRSHFVPRDK